MVFFILDVISAFVIVLMGILVLVRNPKKAVNYTFLGFSISVSLLVLSIMLMHINPFPEYLTLIDRATDCFGAMVILFLLAFSRVYPDKEITPKWQSLLYYLPIFVIAVLSISTPWFIESITVENMVIVQETFGILQPVFIGSVLIYFIAIVINLFNTYRRSESRKIRQQLQFFFLILSICVLATIIFAGILPFFQIFVFHHFGVSIVTSVFTVCFGYILMSKRVFDFQSVALKSAGWLILSLMVFLFLAGFYYFLDTSLKGIDSIQKTIITILLFVILYLYMQKVQPYFNKIFSRTETDREAVLTKLAEELLQLRNIEKLLLKIEDTVKYSTGADRVTIYTVSGKTYNNLLKPGDNILIPKKLMDFLLFHNEILELDDPQIDTTDAELTKTIHEYSPNGQIALVAPLIYAWELVGVMHISPKKNRRDYSHTDIDFLNSFKNQAVLALNNALLVNNLETIVQNKTQELQEKNQTLEYLIGAVELDNTIFRAINEISRLLLSVNYYTVEEFFSTVIQIIPSCIEIEKVSLYRYSHEENHFRFFKGTNRSLMDIEFERLVAKTDGDPMTETAKLGEPRYVADISTLAAKTISEYQIKKSIVSIPIRFESEVIAIINLIDKLGKEDYTENDMNFFHTLTHFINLAYEKTTVFEAKLKSERFASIGLMASNIIHDIKNPMTTIKGFAELICSQEFPEDQKRDFAKLISSEVSRLLDLTTEILEFSRGQIRINKTRNNLREYISEIEENISALLQQKNIGFKTRIDFEAELTFDREKMKRVFFNIAHNAMDALEEGGFFEIAANLNKRSVTFILKDNGPGIPEEIRDTLFEPFVTYGKEHGTGLGLAIVRDIVLKHSGRIYFESSSSTGTSFYIEIPMEE